MRHFLSRPRLVLLGLTTLLWGAGCISFFSSPDRSMPRENIHAAQFARMEARPGRDREVIQLLRDSLPLVQAEPATVHWFALRLGPTSFGLFATFLDDTARQSHLQGPPGAALTSRASELFTRSPDIQPVEPIATKSPPLGPDATVRQGLVLTLEARPGKEGEVRRFLEESLPVVRDEPGTTHWFAFRLSPSRFGVVATFPSDAGLQAHLNGRVAEELLERTQELLTGPPVVEQVDVIAARP